MYSSMVQWATVELMLILHCFLGFQIQSIDFTNEFYQTDIPRGEHFYIELTKDINSNVLRCVVFVILKKTYMVNPKSHSSVIES